MTNLTDKWKKGELPEETECYVRVNGDIYLGSIQYKNGCHNKKLPYVKSFNGQFITKYVDEVLAKVPSYEEYQKLLSDQLAKNEGVEINTELEKRLKKTQELELEVRQENTKLKELLKECREFFYENLIDTEFHFSCGLGSNIKKQSCIRSLSNLKTKIDQALGEE